MARCAWRLVFKVLTFAALDLLVDSDINRGE